MRTTVPASDLDHSLVLLGFTMFDCTSPALLVLGTWTRTFIHTPLMVHTPPPHNTLGEQWHWPDRGIWLIVTKQSKRSTHVRPRTLALLALTYKLSLLLWCSPSGNEYLSTYCFQLEWTIGNMVSALQRLLQSEMGKWYKEGRTKDVRNEKKK